MARLPRPAGLPRGVWCAGAALAVGAVGAAVPVLELALFRRFGASPVPGPYELDGTVSGGSGAGSSVRWVWLGDSLSAGVGAHCAGEALPRQAAAMVASQVGCDVELICLAVPGAVAADVLAGQVPAALPNVAQGAVAVVAVGCNDVLRMVRPSVFRTTYTEILQAIGATGASVVAVGVPDLGSMMAVMAQPLRGIVGWAAGRANSVVRDVATQSGAQYVSISGRQLRGRRRRQRALSLLSTDRFHPNGAGYREWADLVSPTLVRLAEARAAPR